MKYKTIGRLAILSLGSALILGCGGRDAGPSEREYGQILFWEVTDTELLWDQCTDASDFRGTVEAPEFEENSFIVYRVSDDGSELIDQTCETTDADTCSDSDLNLVFERDGSDYLHDPEPTVGDEVAAGCRLVSDPLWTLSDEGTQLFLDVGLTFSLQGDGCEGVDENIARTGMNEFGIDGCTTTIAVTADFFRRDSP